MRELKHAILKNFLVSRIQGLSLSWHGHKNCDSSCISEPCMLLRQSWLVSLVVDTSN